MLSEIEPDKSVSGGTWYHDGEFAAAWISSLREMARSYLENNMSKVTTLQELHTYIQQQPGPSAPTEEDVQAIMRTLELDEIVYSVQSETGQMIYVPRQRLVLVAPCRGGEAWVAAQAYPRWQRQSSLPGLDFHP